MVAALVFIQIGNRTDFDGLHMELHAVPGVKTVHFLAGPTDVIAFVEAADMKAFMSISGKLRGVKGVMSTDTRFVLPA